MQEVGGRNSDPYQLHALAQMARAHAPEATKHPQLVHSVLNKNKSVPIWRHQKPDHTKTVMIPQFSCYILSLFCLLCWVNLILKSFRLPIFMKKSQKEKNKNVGICTFFIHQHRNSWWILKSSQNSPFFLYLNELL